MDNAPSLSFPPLIRGTEVQSHSVFVDAVLPPSLILCEPPCPGVGSIVPSRFHGTVTAIKHILFQPLRLVLGLFGLAVAAASVVTSIHWVTNHQESRGRRIATRSGMRSASCMTMCGPGAMLVSLLPIQS